MKRDSYLSSLLAVLALGTGCDTVPEPEIIDQELIQEDLTLVDRIADPEIPDYIVVQDTGVWATLTVEPGVRVDFRHGAGLWIGSPTGEGAIVAVGTADKPIVLAGEGTGPGSWLGLGVGSPSSLNRLEHVVLRDAGEAPAHDLLDTRAGLTLWDGRLDVVDSEITDNDGIGFFVASSPGEAPVIDDFARNTVTANADVPVKLTTNLFGILDGQSQYAGNGDDHAVLYEPDFGAVPSAAVTAQALDVPYRIEGALNFWTEAHIGPGVTFDMAPGSQIVVGTATGEGSLTIEGTAEAPVKITGVDPTPGSWGGIFVGSKRTANRFTHVEIAYGGGIQPVDGQPANIVVADRSPDASLLLEDSTIRDSAGWGVFVTDRGTLSESGNTFSSNASGPIGP